LPKIPATQEVEIEGLWFKASLWKKISVTLSQKSSQGWGQRGEMNQALYAHMNNKRKRKKKSSQARC
jgi:hypothetical protein